MLATLLVLICVVVRVLPHPPNMAPVGAAGVLAGRTLPTGLAIAVVVAAMALSNIALSLLHGWPAFGWGSPFIYAGFVAQVVIARAPGWRGRRARTARGRCTSRAPAATSTSSAC